MEPIDFEFEALDLVQRPDPDVTVPLHVFATLHPAALCGQIDLLVVLATGQTLKFEDLSAADQARLDDHIMMLFAERGERKETNG